MYPVMTTNTRGDTIFSFEEQAGAFSDSWTKRWVENQKSVKIFLPSPKLILIHKNKDILFHEYLFLRKSL